MGNKWKYYSEINEKSDIALKIEHEKIE